MQNYDVKKIYEWPFLMQFIVIALVSFIFFYLMFILDIDSLKNEISFNAQQENDLKQQLKQIVEKETIAVSDVTELAELNKTLTQWQGKFVTLKQMPDLQDQILKFGQDNQIKFTTFNPGKEIQEKESGYVKVPILISMLGTYQQIGTFLSNVANMNNFVKISDVSISRPDEKGAGANHQTQANTTPSSENMSINSDALLRANLTLEVYRS